MKATIHDHQPRPNHPAKRRAMVTGRSAYRMERPPDFCPHRRRSIRAAAPPAPRLSDLQSRLAAHVGGSDGALPGGGV
jgi:hypothetical protein